MGHDEQRISDQIDSGLLKQKEIEDTENGNKVLAEFMKRDCENCKTTTKQIITLYDPNDPILGRVWQCTKCKQHTSWAD